jgi:hypothetical protein
VLDSSSSRTRIRASYTPLDVLGILFAHGELVDRPLVSIAREDDAGFDLQAWEAGLATCMHMCTHGACA